MKSEMKKSEHNFLKYIFHSVNILCKMYFVENVQNKNA